MDARMHRKIAGLFFIIFITASLLHYFSQRPLWLDEEAILENIQDFNCIRIFGSLKRLQVFPRVYLVLIKFFSAPFNYHILTLRFFPLLFMLVACYVWFKLYRINLSCADNKWLALFPALFFTSSYRLIYYAAELKPYSMDVLAVALYCLFFHYQRKFQEAAPGLRLYLFAALLPFLIFFSYTGLFVFWIVSFNFLLMLPRNKRVLPVLLLNVISSAICLTVFYIIDLQYSVNLQGLHDYWQSYFLCTDSILCFLDTFGEGLRRIVTYWGGASKGYLIAASIFIPFFVFAFFKYGLGNWRKNRFRIFDVDSLCFVLFAELMILGMLKKYPFTGERITLFFAPFVFYMIIKGIAGLHIPDSRILPSFCHGKTRIIKNGFLIYCVIYCVACMANGFNIYLIIYQAQ